VGFREKFDAYKGRSLVYKALIGMQMRARVKLKKLY